MNITCITCLSSSRNAFSSNLSCSLRTRGATGAGERACGEAPVPRGLPGRTGGGWGMHRKSRRRPAHPRAARLVRVLLQAALVPQRRLRAGASGLRPSHPVEPRPRRAWARPTRASRRGQSMSTAHDCDLTNDLLASDACLGPPGSPSALYTIGKRASRACSNCAGARQSFRGRRDRAADGSDEGDSAWKDLPARERG